MNTHLKFLSRALNRDCCLHDAMRGMGKERCQAFTHIYTYIISIGFAEALLICLQATASVPVLPHAEIILERKRTGRVADTRTRRGRLVTCRDKKNGHASQRGLIQVEVGCG